MAAGSKNKRELNSNRTDKQLVLRDGRKLGYVEYGDPGGIPLIYLHGWPSSRLAWTSDPGDAFHVDRQIDAHGNPPVAGFHGG